MRVKIEESWRRRLQDEFDKPYFERLVAFVRSEYARAQVLPPGHEIFQVFNTCPFEAVKVVILGQDPYPNPGQYYGVCFSVPEGVAIPGSLYNIFREIESDLGKPVPSSGNLDRWVRQGSIPHELGTHRAGPRDRFASQQGVGDLYRCRYRQVECRARKSRLYVVGELCPGKGVAYRYPQTSGAYGGTSVAPLGRPWFFRLSPLQSGQRFFAKPGHDAHRLVRP